MYNNNVYNKSYIMIYNIWYIRSWFKFAGQTDYAMWCISRNKCGQQTQAVILIVRRPISESSICKRKLRCATYGWNYIYQPTMDNVHRSLIYGVTIFD